MDLNKAMNTSILSMTENYTQFVKPPT